MQDPSDTNKTRAYWEAWRLRDQQRRQLGIGREYNGPDNVVSFREFRERRVQRPDNGPPVKPAA